MGSNATAPSATQSADPSQEPTPKAALSTGATVGIVIGVIAAIAGVVGAVLFFRRRKAAGSGIDEAPDSVRPPPARTEETSDIKELEDYDALKLEDIRPSPFSELGSEGSIHQLEANTPINPFSDFGDGRMIHQLDGESRQVGGHTRPDTYELGGSDVAELTGSDIRRAELDGSAALRPRKGSAAAHNTYER